MKEVNLVVTEIVFNKFFNVVTSIETFNIKHEEVAHLYLREDENRAYVIFEDGVTKSYPLDRCIVTYKEILI